MIIKWFKSLFSLPENILVNNYVKNVVVAVENETRDVDVLVNVVVIPGALPNETVSVHVERMASTGSRFGVWACWMLSWMIQRDHCKRAVDGSDTPWWVYVRVMFWISLGIWLVLYLARCVISVF